MKRISCLLSVLLWAALGCVAAQAQESGGAMDTVQSALENNRTNQGSTWVNPDSGGSGTVVPLRTFENAAGEPCREFQQTIVIGGRKEHGYGTACRQPDGSWRIVSGEPEGARTVEKRTTVYVREAPWPYYSYPYSYYYPYGYYPWGYRYPYGYPFSFSLNLGYLYHDGGHHHGKYYGGKHYGGKHYGGHGGGKHHGGHRGGGRHR